MSTVIGWKVRHEGAPQAMDGLSFEQVVDGLHEALWEPTDEVQAPGEATWTAIENHPQLAEIAADIEPVVSTRAEEEVRAWT